MLFRVLFFFFLNQALERPTKGLKIIKIWLGSWFCSRENMLKVYLNWF